MRERLRVFRTGCSVLSATALVLGAASVESGQSDPVESTLVDTAGLIEVDDSSIRCGSYFVLESRSYSGFDVKQVHVVLSLSQENVALVSLYFNDIQTILDDSKKSPVLRRSKDESGKETDVVRLSSADFGEAKECLPPP